MRDCAEILTRDGIVCIDRALDRAEFDSIIERIGAVIAKERIQLRPGAHAYVAKPGRVPLHTDHPDVDFIAWHCVEQDRDDGASLLLDTRPILAAMQSESPANYQRLFETSLVCPPLAGGPPTLQRAVLRSDRAGTHLFCSPWLTAVDNSDGRGEALAELRERLSSAAKTGCVAHRMQRGGAVIVDNRRVLHGRAAIAEDSKRQLRRVWIARW
jgi:hypothetical protein